MRIKVESQYHSRLTERHLRMALKWINPLDLVGVEYIRLMLEASVDPKLSKQPAYLRSPVTVARYVRPNPKAKNAEPTHIDIYTRSFYYGIPPLLKYTSVATLRMAFVLAHEVGHHLIARRGYIYEPTERYKPNGFHDERQEAASNKYAINLVRSMSAHWRYRVVHWVNNKVSEWYFSFGAIAWERSEYRRAAYYWFCSYCANPDNSEAEQWYQRAKTNVTDSAAKSNNGMQRTRRHELS